MRQLLSVVIRPFTQQLPAARVLALTTSSLSKLHYWQQLHLQSSSMAIKLGAAVVVAFALYYLCAASLIGQVAAQSGEATYYTPPYTRKHNFMQIRSLYIVIHVTQLRLELI